MKTPKSRGRPPLPKGDAKLPIVVFVEEVRVEKFGGEDSIKQIIYNKLKDLEK